MNEQAEEEVINLFNRIKALDDEISSLRMEATNKEKQLQALKEKWSMFSSLLDIEFDTKEKEEVHQDVNIGFNFHSDINKKIH